MSAAGRHVARTATRRRWRAIATALVASGVVVGFACGGTTGQDGPPPGGAIGEADSGGVVDATVNDDVAVDAGTFDVQIFYADRVLPDVVAAPPPSAGEAGYPWPDCPPFVPITPRNGRLADAANELDQIPASFDSMGNVLLDDAGRVVPAPDGSACATYGWLGSTTIDEELTSAVTGQGLGILLPPCNWCIDAGTEGQGPGAGRPKYDVCLDLYACIKRTGCGLAADNFSILACLCGDASANCTATGPCGQEELAALQSSGDPASIETLLSTEYTITDPSKPAYCGGMLNQLIELTISGDRNHPAPSGFFPKDAGPF